MKQQRILLLASVALLMFGCKAQNAGSEQAAVIPAPTVTETAAVEKPSAQQLLESKFKKDMPYADLRKIVLADGWSPLKTEACKENVGGEAEICDRQPEVEACSGDGHCNMYFISSDGGTKLRVGTYNDSVSFWEFSSQDSSNAQKRQAWDMPLSKEACTEKGYWSFFEAFVKSDVIKKSHTASGVQLFDYSSNKKVTDKFSRFKIGLVDNLWVYLDS